MRLRVPREGGTTEDRSRPCGKHGCTTWEASKVKYAAYVAPRQHHVRERKAEQGNCTGVTCNINDMNAEQRGNHTDVAREQPTNGMGG